MSLMSASASPAPGASEGPGHVEPGRSGRPADRDRRAGSDRVRRDGAEHGAAVRDDPLDADDPGERHLAMRVPPRRRHHHRLPRQPPARHLDGRLGAGRRDAGRRGGPAAGRGPGVGVRPCGRTGQRGVLPGADAHGRRLDRRRADRDLAGRVLFVRVHGRPIGRLRRACRRGRGERRPVGTRAGHPGRGRRRRVDRSRRSGGIRVEPRTSGLPPRAARGSRVPRVLRGPVRRPVRQLGHRRRRRSRRGRPGGDRR